MRAFRGATTVAADEPDLIRAAVKELVAGLLAANEIVHDDLVDAIVTVSPDLTSMFAGTAIREECGFDDVPLLGALEAGVATGPPRCIRVMIHAYTTRSRPEVVHVYHGSARGLRPDLTES